MASAHAQLPTHPSFDSAQPSYVPNRVYATGHRRFIDFESMLANASGADVLFLGSRHDDPGTHRLEAATLEGLARRRSNVVLAMEIFERDVQPSLDNYLAGHAQEHDFLAGSRPWPRYLTDYRPLVELARASKWPVIASDVPRRLASLAARRGLKIILDSINATDRAFAAAPPRALVVHVNGAFHSDYGLGTAERVKRRLPGKRITVVTFVPVKDLDSVDAKPEHALADFIVFTLAPPARATGAA